MIRSNVIIAVLGLLVFISGGAHAECMACASARGVHFALKDGSSVDGYIAWNEFDFDEIIQSTTTSATVNAYLAGKGWSSRRPADVDDCFSRWIELANKVLSNGGFDSPYFRDRLVYKKLLEIRYPASKFVGIEGDVVKLSWEDVSSIAANPNLKLAVDMTGIDVLPRADADRLASEKPRFTVEQGFDVGSTVYAVYGETVTVSQILSHIIRNSSVNDLGDISIDETPIIARKDGPQLSGSLAMKEQRTPHEEEALGVINKLEQYRRELKATLDPCEKEVADLRGGAISMVNAAAIKSPQTERAAAMSKICRKKELAIQDRYWTSLGTKEEMRKLGVLVFTNGWD